MLISYVSLCCYQSEIVQRTMVLASALYEVDFTHILVSFYSLPVQINVIGISQTMWILFFLHYTPSLTPLIVQSGEGRI